MFKKNETQNKINKLKKNIKELRKVYRRLEFRPCQSDAELMAKELELDSLMDRIYNLESEQDRYILDSVRNNLK